MTNFCNKCNVKVDKHHTNCPLCGAYIASDEIVVINTEASAPKEVIDYSFPRINMESIIKNLLFKIALFISIFASITVLVIDFLTSTNLNWCFHVMVGIALFWITLGRSLFFKTNFGKQIVWDCIFSVLLIIYVQYVIGQLNAWWGYMYAAPSIIMAFDITIVIAMAIKTKNWAQYSLSATILCLISIIPFCYGFAFGMPHFMTYICAGLGILILFVMIVFGKKSYFMELKKRFHI